MKSVGGGLLKGKSMTISSPNPHRHPVGASMTPTALLVLSLGSGSPQTPPRLPSLPTPTCTEPGKCRVQPHDHDPPGYDCTTVKDRGTLYTREFCRFR